MRIGVFGGTFDPPHIGHFILAEHVREEIHLDRVAFVPCNIPPHKQQREITDGDHRLAMIRLAVGEDHAFEVLDVELQRGGVSYTVDTLELLRNLRPSDEFYLLVGMDNIPEFHTWRQPERILELATLVVLRRPGYPIPPLELPGGTRVLLCDVPMIGLSSTELRDRVRHGKTIKYRVPTAVEQYIHSHSLYLRVSTGSGG
jgi:nicotinate-nucleotide adenylyltransferase